MISRKAPSTSSTGASSEGTPFSSICFEHLLVRIKDLAWALINSQAFLFNRQLLMRLEVCCVDNS